MVGWSPSAPVSRLFWAIGWPFICCMPQVRNWDNEAHVAELAELWDVDELCSTQLLLNGSWPDHGHVAKRRGLVPQPCSGVGGRGPPPAHAADPGAQ